MSIRRWMIGSMMSVLGFYGCNGAGLSTSSESQACSVKDVDGVKTLVCPDGTSTSLEGPKGETGAVGPAGAQGEKGDPGAAGENGTDGASVTIAALTIGDSNCPFGGVSITVGADVRYVCHGEQGVSGAQGLQGLQGAPGDQVQMVELLVGDEHCPDGGVSLTLGGDVKYVCDGERGSAGIAGERGQDGMTGQQGLMGPMGPMGPEGPMGQMGPMGPMGLDGQPGPIGPPGEMGPQGPQGPQGPAADTSLLQARVYQGCSAGMMIRSINSDGTVVCDHDGRFGGGRTTTAPPTGGSECYIGEVRLFAGNFNPEGWYFADGRLLQIAQNQALFSILGTQYGGNGIQTFALPDLRDTAPNSTGGGAVHYMICAWGYYPSRP